MTGGLMDTLTGVLIDYSDPSSGTFKIARGGTWTSTVTDNGLTSHFLSIVLPTPESGLSVMLGFRCVRPITD